MLLLLLLLPPVTQMFSVCQHNASTWPRGQRMLPLILQLISSNTLRSYVPARDYQVATRVSVMRMPCDVEVLFQLQNLKP